MRRCGPGRGSRQAVQVGGGGIDGIGGVDGCLVRSATWVVGIAIVG